MLRANEGASFGTPAPASARSPLPGPTRIRRAETPADIDMAVAVVARAHGESIFKSLPFAPEKLKAAGLKYLKTPDRTRLLLAERQDAQGHAVVTGLCVGSVEAFLFSPARGAMVHLLYVVPEARGSLAAVKLLRAFRAWATAREARLIGVHVTGNIGKDRAHKLLTRLGFRLTGGNYALVLPDP